MMWEQRCRAKMGVLDLCRIALFVNSMPDGGFFTDSGWWSEVARRAKYVADTCLVDQYIGGGAAHAGK